MGYASEGYAGGENERPDCGATLPWGEQAALLQIEEQECTIADLTTTNEVPPPHHPLRQAPASSSSSPGPCLTILFARPLPVDS